MFDSVLGIVIRTYASREADLVLRVITHDQGKISLLARSARKSRKRAGSSFDLFDRGTFEIIPGKSTLQLVQNFIPGKPLHSLRQDLVKITCATALCEVVDLLTHEGAVDNESAYETLSLAFDTMEAAKTDKESLRACYLATALLLRSTGYGTELSDAPPSSHNLARLLNFVEECAERKLESKSSLGMIISTL